MYDSYRNERLIICVKYEASSGKDMHKSVWMARPKPYSPEKDSDKQSERQEGNNQDAEYEDKESS